MRQPRVLLPENGVVGVDPGRSSGSIAYVVGDEAFTWPLKNMTDLEIWSVFERLGGCASFAVLERVNAMPKQGVASSFKFGASFGELKMALVAARLRFELVTPATWQGKLRCRTKGDKNITKTLAQRLWPGVKITHATADALLLAEYGRRHLSA